MTRGCTITVLLGLALAAVACISEPELELPPPRYEEREKALAVVREKLELLAGGDVDAAVDLLGHEDHRVRRAAAQRLGEIGEAVVAGLGGDGGVDGAGGAADGGDAAIADHGAVARLIERLDDEHPRVQTAAALALGEIGDHRAIDPLVETLVDKDRFVRLWAWKGLRKFGDDAVPVLLAHTSSQSPFRDYGYKDEAGNRLTIRAPLRDHLTSLGRGVVPLLNEALGNEQEDGWVRINAAIILGAIGADAAEALPTMLAHVDTTNKRLRLEIVRSLGHIGDLDPEVAPTLERLSKDRNRKISGAAKAALKEIAKVSKDKAAKEKKKRDREKKREERLKQKAAQGTDDKSGRPGAGPPPRSGVAPVDPSGALVEPGAKKEPLTGQEKVPAPKKKP